MLAFCSVDLKSGDCAPNSLSMTMTPLHQPSFIGHLRIEDNRYKELALSEQLKYVIENLELIADYNRRHFLANCSTVPEARLPGVAERHRHPIQLAQRALDHD